MVLRARAAGVCRECEGGMRFRYPCQLLNFLCRLSQLFRYRRFKDSANSAPGNTSYTAMSIGRPETSRGQNTGRQLVKVEVKQKVYGSKTTIFPRLGVMNLDKRGIRNA